MGAKNLSIVFAPNILYPENADPSKAASEMNQSIETVTLLVKEMEYFFYNTGEEEKGGEPNHDELITPEVPEDDEKLNGLKEVADPEIPDSSAPRSRPPPPGQAKGYAINDINRAIPPSTISQEDVYGAGTDISPGAEPRESLGRKKPPPPSTPNPRKPLDALAAAAEAGPGSADR